MHVHSKYTNMVCFLEISKGGAQFCATPHQQIKEARRSRINIIMSKSNSFCIYAHLQRDLQSTVK